MRPTKPPLPTCAHPPAMERRVANLTSQLLGQRDFSCARCGWCDAAADGGCVQCAGAAAEMSHEELEEGSRLKSKSTPNLSLSRACTATTSEVLRLVRLSWVCRTCLLRCGTSHVLPLLPVDFEKLRSVAATESSVVPCCVQHVDTKEVLIIAYVNEEALQKSIETNIATFWSTSRNELWVKGLTSGDYLDLHEIRVNCEQSKPHLRESAQDDASPRLLTGG